MALYTRGTQRKQALDSGYFADCSRANRKQRKLAKRRANKLYAELGTTSGLKLAKNVKLDNRKFRVCELREVSRVVKHTLDYSPAYRTIEYGSVENLRDGYKYSGDKTFLDSIQAKRRKN